MVQFATAMIISGVAKKNIEEKQNGLVKYSFRRQVFQ